MNLKETYNKIAEDWYRDHQSDTWWIEGTDAFCKFVSKGNLVLDVGCGAGAKSKYISGKGLRMRGFDFSENLIEIAKKEVPEVQFDVLDMYDIDSVRGVFDGVFVQAVLLHIPKKDIPTIFEKLARKVKLGGYLYIAVKEIKPGQPAEEIKREDDYGYPFERFFSYFTMEELKEYFSLINFKIVYTSREQSGRTTWLQIIGQRAHE